MTLSHSPKENILQRAGISNNIILLFVFSFVVLFFCSKCSPLYFFNEWMDVNIYFTIGKGLFNGKVIYRDMFDHKGPLIFFIYGLGSFFSNASFWGIYIFESLALFVNLLFAYKIGKLFLDRDKAFFVPIFYAFLLLCRTKQGGSADEFIAPCLMISLYYTLYYCIGKVKDINILNRHFLIHGIMFGIVLFVKLSISVFFIPLIFIPFYEQIRKKEFKNAISISLRFLIGFFIIAVPVLGYFIINGAFSDFWFAYIQFNSLYASGSMGFTFDAFANIAARFILRLMEPDFFVYMLTFSMISLIFSKKFFSNIFYKISIFLSFSFLYIIDTSGPHDMDYYYITLSAFSVFGFIFIIDFSGKYIKDKWMHSLKPLFLLLILTACIFYKDFSVERLASLTKQEDTSSFWQKDFATIINKQKNPTVLEINHYSGVANLANVIPPYKYFFHPNIHDDIFPDIKESHIELIKAKSPMFIIAANADFPYLLDNYEIVAQHGSDGNYTYLLERKQ